MHINNNILTNS